VLPCNEDDAVDAIDVELPGRVEARSAGGLDLSFWEGFNRMGG
jgi:hypothetical protein